MKTSRLIVITALSLCFTNLNAQIPSSVSNIRDWSQDMAMKITGPFTFAAVGDVIITRPANEFQDSGLQAALSILRDADVGFGNFESTIRDQQNFAGPLGGSMNGTKEVAADLKAMGFDLVNRAGNHLMDSDEEGMFEMTRLMEEAGLIYAGIGRNLDEARAPRFVEISKGRVGLVGMYGQTGNGRRGLAATYQDGIRGGRAGLNSLRVTRTIIVRPEDLDAMKLAKDAVYSRRLEVSNPVNRPASEPDGIVNLFGELYQAGDKPGDLHYSMNISDLEENLRSIRNGKQYADFMIATIHAHQGDTLLQPFLFEDSPPDFLIELAHSSIDSGADAFVGHGPHLLRGIEIYNGKPIFYNLGEFFREWDWNCDCDYSPDRQLTQAESVVLNHDNRGVDEPINYESVLALSQFDEGELKEIHLYPIWARQDAPLSRRGLPMIAPPEIAQRILRRMQELSDPFGTTIEIENNVGVIRVD